MGFFERRAQRNLRFLEDGEEVLASDVVELVTPPLGLSAAYLSDRALHFLPKSQPGTLVTAKATDLVRAWEQPGLIQFATVDGNQMAFAAVRRFDAKFAAALDGRLKVWFGTWDRP